MDAGPKFYLIAGEPSGDRLGAALMRGLGAETAGKARFLGIGGDQMAREGLASLFDMSELSIMGLVEVLPRIRGLLRRVSQTVDAVAAARPDALITIDSPDYCLRVARKVKAAHPEIPVIHYVAPQVWAWRPKRVYKMARYIDHVLALLPFEPPYMTAAGMSCDFVGHPVAGEPMPTKHEIMAFRESIGMATSQKMLLLLPGSRLAELRRMGSLHAEIARRLRAHDPELTIVVPGSASVIAEVRELFDTPELHPIILDPTRGDPNIAERRKRAAFAAADVAFATSGTVSLELAAAGTPMVIAYRGNPISGMLFRRLVRVNTVVLVNLVAENRSVPEFLYEDATAENIVPELRAILDDPSAAAEQLAAGRKTMQRLGRGQVEPGLRAARSVLAALRR